MKIHLRFPVKEDAEKFKFDVSSFFDGSFIYSSDTVLISEIYYEWYHNKQIWLIDIFIKDEQSDKEVTINVGEIIVLGTKKLWALTKEHDIEQRKDTKKS